MDLSSLTDALTGLPIPQIRFFESIGSTNDVGLEWAAAGAEDGCLVVADLQTQGRGRLGRRWVTRPGAALAFSLILQPTQTETSRLGFFTALGALAISQALEDTLGAAPEIKWPNDVLLLGRKTAGILVEAAWLGDHLQGVIIGIGINIAPEAVPPADQLLFPAISVEEAVGRPVDRQALLQAILKALFTWRTQIREEKFLRNWEDRLAFQGAWVQIEQASPGSMPVAGQLVGLASDGSLVLRSASGELTTVAVGDLHLRPTL